MIVSKINKITLISFLFFVFSVLLFVYRNIVGLTYLPFGDESGHLIGAIALHRGDVLYRDYIDAHGPFIFFSTWLLGQIIGFTKVWMLRLVSTIFMTITGLLIFNSTVFQKFWQRYLASGLWFSSTACIWVVQGLYLDSYWTLGGALVLISLSTLILPILYDKLPTLISAIIGGAAIGFLPYTAYPFSFLSAILILAIFYISIKKYHLYRLVFMMFFLGCLSSILIMTVWLYIYGDIVGMVVYHFINNQFYYSRYIPVGFSALFYSLIPTFDPVFYIEDIAILSFFIGSLILFVSAKQRVMVVCVFVAILTLQIRGANGFQNGTFLISSIGLMSITLISSLKNKPLVALFLSLFTLIIIAIPSKYATSSPSNKTYVERKEVKTQLLEEKQEVGFVKEIQKYTTPDQRILVIPYNPDVYIYANRLPIIKYHAYLPWEADYAKHPWLGYERDICVDLPKEKPLVIYFDNLVVWGKYSARDYMSCVTDYMRKEYIQSKIDSNVYIRKDLLN